MSTVKITFEVDLDGDAKVRESFATLMDRIMRLNGPAAVALTKEAAAEAEVPAKVTDFHKPEPKPLYEAAEILDRAQKAEPGITKEPMKDDETATLEQVREAMHDARRRIEGDNWETSRTPLHAAMTAKFKEIAKNLGAAKPSAITDPHTRAMFVRSCECMRKDPETDVIVEDLPF